MYLRRILRTPEKISVRMAQDILRTQLDAVLTEVIQLETEARLLTGEYEGFQRRVNAAQEEKEVQKFTQLRDEARLSLSVASAKLTRALHKKDDLEKAIATSSVRRSGDLDMSTMGISVWVDMDMSERLLSVATRNCGKLWRCLKVFLTAICGNFCSMAYCLLN